MNRRVWLRGLVSLVLVAPLVWAAVGLSITSDLQRLLPGGGPLARAVEALEQVGLSDVVLVEVDGIQWIRLMYFYPMYVNDRLISTIAKHKKIVPYLDMPLQHINDMMLRRMARRVTRMQTENLLAKLRDRIPQLSLRTTFITGFPGETDAQFSELVDFVREQQFERLDFQREFEVQRELELQWELDLQRELEV